MTGEVLALVRAGRRQPLFEPGALPSISDGRSLVQRLLPHRGSMLLIDEILAFDAAAGRIVARRYLAPSDPVFAGHFPGDPVYPGALQVEAVGQCGLCWRSLRAAGDAVVLHAAPVRIRLVRIIAAEFLEPVRPGADALLLAELLEDEPTLCMVGQMVVHGRPTCVCAFEAIVDEVDADAQ